MNTGAELNCQRNTERCVNDIPFMWRHPTATVATDVRGNETLVATAVDPANASRIETIAADGVLNVATNWYTDGVMVSNLSQSAVLTRRAYDVRRRETSRTDGRGNVTRSVYGPDGWLATEIACETNATCYDHDAMGRRLAVTNALGGVTEYAYDTCGRKTYEGGATYPVSYVPFDWARKLDSECGGNGTYVEKYYQVRPSK